MKIIGMGIYGLTLLLFGFFYVLPDPIRTLVPDFDERVGLDKAYKFEKFDLNGRFSVPLFSHLAAPNDVKSNHFFLNLRTYPSGEVKRVRIEKGSYASACGIRATQVKGSYPFRLTQDSYDFRMETGIGNNRESVEALSQLISKSGPQFFGSSMSQIFVFDGEVYFDYLPDYDNYLGQLNTQRGGPKFWREVNKRRKVLSISDRSSCPKIESQHPPLMSWPTLLGIEA